MKKRVLAAVVAATAVLSLAGCKDSGTSSGSGDSGTASTPAASNTGDNSTPAASNGGDASTPSGELVDEDDTLSILSWSNNEDMTLLIDMFCEKTGTDKSKIQWVKQGDAGGDAKTKYKEYLKGSGDADLLFCDAGWAQLYENDADLVIPMSELGITKSQYPDAYPYTLEVGTNEKGEFMAPTWQATPGLFVYNAKVAKEHLGVETPEAMQALVKDWDTFEKTAATLKEKTNGAVKMVATEAGLWQVKQCDKTTKWVNGSDFVLTGEADKFADMAKKYTDNGWVDINIGAWSGEWWATMADESSLGEFVPTWGLKGNSGSMIFNFAAGGTWQDVEDPDNPGQTKKEYVINDTAATDKLSACAGPQSWYWGGTYICAAKKINTKKTAAEFIKFFTQNAANMKEYGQNNGDFMNNKNIMKEVTFTNPVLIGGQDQFKILVSEADKVNMGGTITKYDSDINDAFNGAVTEYCKGEVSSKDDAIAKAKSKIAEAYPDLNVAD